MKKEKLIETEQGITVVGNTVQIAEMDAEEEPSPKGESDVSKIRYCAGLLIDESWSAVLLIRKNRPLWMSGKLNAVGGKVEDNETPVQAMRREFREETGVDIDEDNWYETVVTESENHSYVVHYFRAWRSAGQFPQTVTSEPVSWYPTYNLPDKIMSNLRWIIPLSLDTCIEKPVHVIDLGEN